MCPFRFLSAFYCELFFFAVRPPPSVSARPRSYQQPWEGGGRTSWIYAGLYVCACGVCVCVCVCACALLFPLLVAEYLLSVLMFILTHVIN